MAKSKQMISQDEKHKIQDAEIRETLRHIKHKILVMSGKGGVGKSSVAAYLAVILWQKPRGGSGNHGREDHGSGR